ncbi:MAG: tetratricopeptide repeat protein, partial [Bacteroidetes bacterium]|nr:tetratricopeptide repeat protein [Bacteroidota bacterium]
MTTESRSVLCSACGLLMLLALACSGDPQTTQTEAPARKPTAREDTLRILNKRIKENPNDPNLYYRRSQLIWEEGDTVLAMADIDRALDIEPDNADYLYLRGTFHYMRGRDKAAEKDLDEAVRMRSTNPNAYYLMGNIAFLRKEYDKALHWMDRAIKIDGKVPIFYVGKALVYRAQGQTGRAITHANYALEHDKNFLKASALLADIYLNEQYDLKQARKYTYFMLEADSLHPLGRAQMGLILYKESQAAADETTRKSLLQKAVEQYSMAIRKDTRYADAFYQRGYMQQELGRLDAAEADYKQVLALNPGDFRAAFMLGSIYEKYEDWAQSRQYYQQALDAKPDYADARQALN